MTARVVYLSAPESRGLLAGRVSLLLRPVTEHGRMKVPSEWEMRMFHDEFHIARTSAPMGVRVYCPFGVPGDALWGAEACCADRLPTGEKCINYRAGGRVECEDSHLWHTVLAGMRTGWMPSNRMPREASRHALTLASVRVVRVRELSPSDCCDAGCFEDGAYAKEPGVPYPVATFKAAWTAR